jgi:hypothetical protein
MRAAPGRALLLCILAFAPNIRGKVIGKLRDQMRADLDRERAAAEQLR